MDFKPMSVNDSLTVPRLLADKYCIRILSATFNKPRNSQDLSIMLGIPIASCYRKIKELEKNELIKPVSKSLTGFGKWVENYQSQINSVNISFRKNRLKVRLDLAWKPVQEFEEVLA